MCKLTRSLVTAISSRGAHCQEREIMCSSIAANACLLKCDDFTPTNNHIATSPHSYIALHSNILTHNSNTLRNNSTRPLPITHHHPQHQHHGTLINSYFSHCTHAPVFFHSSSRISSLDAHSIQAKQSQSK